MIQDKQIVDYLTRLYGAEVQPAVSRRLDTICERYQGRIPPTAATGLDERDAILITYPDQIQENGKPPLQVLTEFANQRLRGLVNGIHLLPFYPWSSDDGFSVKDYRHVAAEYGSWDDISRLGGGFRLMFDAVLNHTSAESEWFQAFLQDKNPYRDYFIRVHGSPDLSRVARPRAQPLLTTFKTIHGKEALWTTFGPDQVDLDYRNPDVFLEMVAVLLFYVNHGASFLRFDAAGYLWKEPGTSCLNLPQTHCIVRLMRRILAQVAPHVMLITETNVAQADSLAYFGDGTNEAQLIYNFAFPPLVLHAFQTGSSETLASWASGLSCPSDQVTFLNFLASHDGIGLNAVRGILQDKQIEALAQRVEAGGALVSHKSNVDGTLSPYELNGNYLDALDAVGRGDRIDVQVERFLTAHAILLSFRGVPAIYFHSLFGSRGWKAGPARTGLKRSINREKLQRDQLQAALAEANSLRRRVFGGLRHLLRLRGGQTAFSPHAEQRVLDPHAGVFALVRGDGSREKHVVCLYNVTGEAQDFRLEQSGAAIARGTRMRDLITDRQIEAGGSSIVTLNPYQAMWLTT